MGSSLSNILPSVLGGAASLIPGVGAIAGPLVGGVASSVLGGGDTSGGAAGGSAGAPYNVQNSLANLSQMVGPASAAMQVAQSDQKLANDLQNNALTGQGNATTNAQNSLRNLYSSIPNPSTTQGPSVAQVAPQTISSVMGNGRVGSLPQMTQQSPYAQQIAQLAPQFMQQPNASAQPLSMLPVGTQTAAGGGTGPAAGATSRNADTLDPHYQITQFTDGTWALSDPYTGQDGTHNTAYGGGATSEDAAFNTFNTQYGTSLNNPDGSSSTKRVAA